MRAELREKYQRLLEEIRGMGRVIIAFSGGVDSSLLLKAASEALPKEDVLAVTIHSLLMPNPDLAAAKRVAKLTGVEHRIIESNEFADDDLTANSKDRCYFCKHGKYTRLSAIARKEGYHAVLDGSNLSDQGDYRPGFKAIRELELVRTPLLDCGLTKEEIREISRELGLPTWNQPSRACLSSRIPYGDQITSEKIAMVSKAEDRLAGLGLSNFRVRCHGNLARIEVDPAEFPKIFDQKRLRQLAATVKDCGFTYVTLDLEGYRTGSMNEVLPKEQR